MADATPPLELRDLLRLLRPHDATGVGKVRLGGNGDGGYVMLDDFIGIERAIGAGVGFDVSFERALAERGIEVHLYDHTVDRLPENHAKLHFHRRNLVAQPTPDADTLEAAAAALHTQPRRAVLKIDIEGDEWAIFAVAKRETLQCFRQIVCELHDLSQQADAAWHAGAHAALLNVTRDFAVVHVHANNYGYVDTVDGKPAPTVLEVTFANRQCYATLPSSLSFPTPLDRPNNSKQPDVVLGEFVF